jgi:cyclase
VKKMAFLVVFLSLLITHPTVGQQQTGPANPPPVNPDKGEAQIHKLSSNLYWIQFVGVNGGNFGGNVVASVGDDGIVLVDAGYAPMAPKLAAALKTLSDKPVKYILHTHWHVDHTQADEYFSGTAVIIAQDNVRTRMQTGSKRFPPMPATSYPSITFSHQITLHINGGEIHGIHFPAGHTDGDTIYFYPGANVVQTGDDFTNFNPRNFSAFDQDTDGSGSPQGIIAAGEYVLAHSNEDVKIIPGHGNMVTRADMAQDLAFLEAATAAVQAGIDQGKSVDQLKEEKVLANIDTLGLGPMKEDAAIQRLYTNLTLRRTLTESGGAH